MRIWVQKTLPNEGERAGSGLVVGDGLVTKSCLTLVTPWTVAPQFLCPWDSPGKNTGEGCHFLLQGIFQTQASGLLQGRQILYWLSCREAGSFLAWHPKRTGWTIWMQQTRSSLELCAMGPSHALAHNEHPPWPLLILSWGQRCHCWWGVECRLRGNRTSLNLTLRASISVLCDLTPTP